MSFCQPKISVLLAVYNAERYLDSAILGILNQKFEDFEFLILDDGSTDRTSAILASIKDSRVRVFRHERMGLTRSLNKGLLFARGEYVARQDADDVSREDRLKKQLKFLEIQPEIVLVGSGVTVISEDNDILGDYLYPADHSYLVNQLDRLVSPLPHTTIMFRRATVMDCGGYRESFVKAQDYDLYLRLIENHKIASIPEPLCQIRHSMKSVTSDDSWGQQFQYAVLAYVSSLLRREGEKDPLDLPTRDKFLEKFNTWYCSSSFPKIFRSRQLRRETRLAWSKGRPEKAIFYLVSAILMDRNWLAQQLGYRSAKMESEEAKLWVRDLMTGVC